MADLTKVEDRLQDMVEAIDDLAASISVPPAVPQSPTIVNVPTQAPPVVNVAASPVAVHAVVVEPKQWEFSITERDLAGRVSKFVAKPIL